MKISPVSNTIPLTPQGASTPAVRSLKMNTNATPGNYLSEKSGEELIIPDANGEEVKPVTEATEPISPQFAALAKQRRALQQERRAFLDEKKAHEAASQNSEAVSLARLKSEPLKVLLESGVTYEQLTEAILANQGNPDVQRLETEIKALKEGIDKKFTDQEEAQIKYGLANKSREIDGLLTSDEYELVRATNSKRDVLKLIERTFRETREELDASDALKLMEDELFKRNQKIVTTKKMQGLFTQAAPQAPQRPQGMRTLTNKDTASVPMDRRARALAAALGTLKK